VPEVVEGGEPYGLVLGLDDEGLYDRVLPAGQVVAACGGERDLDRRPPVPGGKLGVPIPLVDRLDVLLARGPQGHRFAVYRLELFGVDAFSPLDPGSGQRKSPYDYKYKASLG